MGSFGIFNIQILLTHSDFEKELKGLQLYDAKNNLNVFESTSFQSIIEKM